MGRKSVGIKGRNIVDDSDEEVPCDDDGSLLGSPKLSRTDLRSKSKTRGKQPDRAAHKKTRVKNFRPKSPTLVCIPEPPPIFSSIFVSRRLYSLGGRLTTPRDLERVRVICNMLPSVRLRVPRKGERPEHPYSDSVALHIDLFPLRSLFASSFIF